MDVAAVFNRAPASTSYVSTLGDLISLLAYLQQFLKDRQWKEMGIVLSDSAVLGVAISRGSFRVGDSRSADRGIGTS